MGDSTWRKLDLIEKKEASLLFLETKSGIGGERDCESEWSRRSSEESWCLGRLARKEYIAFLRSIALMSAILYFSPLLLPFCFSFILTLEN